MDDLSYARGIIPQNSYCLRCDYGNSDFDIRNSFFMYLGLYAAAAFEVQAAIGRLAVQCSVFFLHAARHLLSTPATDSSGTGEYNDRAEVVGNPFQNVPASIAATGTCYWFNPAAFADSDSWHLLQPGTERVLRPRHSPDGLLCLQELQIKERLALQLRAEMFNLFNTVNLSGPNTTATSSGLGQITSTQDVGNGAPGIGVGAPFNVQLGAKITF